MPSNRPDLENTVKKQMIIEAARHVFLTEGFDKASISRIAKEAEVTANTLYWYFKGKDELFAAVLKEFIDIFLLTLSQRRDEFNIRENLIWVIETLKAARPLIITVHQRAEVSPAVAEVHNHFHRSLELLFADTLKHHAIAAFRIKPLIAIASYVVEGVLIHNLASEEQKNILDEFSGLLPS